VADKVVVHLFVMKMVGVLVSPAFLLSGFAGL
jgi:hypothetical protein